MRDTRLIPPLTPRRCGYQDYLVGLGDPPNNMIEAIEAIDWKDGWVIAERILRELDEDTLVFGM